MEKHPILYEYYLKYSGDTTTGVGGNASRLSSSIPRLVNRTINSSKSNFVNSAKNLGRNVKNFSKEVALDVRNGVLSNLRDNVATELLQGKNPYDSFMKNLDERYKNSDEYLYNKQYNSPSDKKIYKSDENYIGKNNIYQSNKDNKINREYFNGTLDYSNESDDKYYNVDEFQNNNNADEYQGDYDTPD
jgi:hypothetical protein